MLKVAISANIMPKDRTRELYIGMCLHYYDDEAIEAFESLSDEVEIILLPIRKLKKTDEFIKNLDLLVLSGGADVHPSFYNEEPTYEWKGYKPRDELEIEWIKSAKKVGTNVLGICRGAQVLNVALGGNLYQDLPTHFSEIGERHRNKTSYDLNFHQVKIKENGYLYTHQKDSEKVVYWTNSVHHQGIKDVAPGCKVEAHSSIEGLVEAISYKDPTSSAFMLGLQWHPEWLQFTENSNNLDEIHKYQPKLKPFLRHQELFLDMIKS